MKEINLNKKEPYGKAKDKALDGTERDLLLNELKDSKDRIILISQGYGGLRVGESAQCRLSWLEWRKFKDKRVLAINIPSEDRDIKNKLKIWRPKTDKKRTTYIFNTELAHELYAWYLMHKNGLLLSERNISEYRVKVKFGKILKRKISSHPLRATAQNYFKYEVLLSVNTIAILLGHSDVRTTIGHYDSKSKANAESEILQKMTNGTG